jgi:diadenosine tetraphosphatase ApaH/serine/threonine PP2A family protein phosphatase
MKFVKAVFNKDKGDGSASDRSRGSSRNGSVTESNKAGGGSARLSPRKSTAKAATPAAGSADDNDDDEDTEPSAPKFNLQKMNSLKKIQQFARKKRAERIAKEEAHWKIFADLDTIEEKEMLHLATFMQVLLEKVPGAKEAEEQSTAAFRERSATNIEGVNIQDMEVEESSSTKVNAAIVSRDPFEISKTAQIDSHIAREIIETFRKGGRLGNTVVMKLLRRAYALLKTYDNTVKVTVPTGGKVTVVGDIHGQLVDLIHILDESGLPSDTNKYVFNGDFVDRGKHGVEVVCILLALFVSDPANVVLNRGNHEDGPITRVYGFQDECVTKFDELTFGMFIEVFRYLPLFVTINDTIFVVHGGLFNNRSVELKELDNIERTDYVAKPPVRYPDCMNGLDPEAQWREYYKQLQRDALWSDPQLEEGLEESSRGAGVIFGPDVAQEFMEKNNLSMIIRAHECVQDGFLLPFVPTSNPAQQLTDAPLLCTLFSASNYGNANNSGAYMIIMNHTHSDSQPIASIGNTSGLHYSIHTFKLSSANLSAIEKSNKSSITELILKKKPALTGAFEAADTNNNGVVSRTEWSAVMQKVTDIKIRWLGIINTIVPPECLTPSTVDYRYIF